MNATVGDCTQWSLGSTPGTIFLVSLFLLALTDILLSIWMMKAQKVFHKPSHTQCGKNPELRALFYRLCYLARFQLSAVLPPSVQNMSDPNLTGLRKILRNSFWCLDLIIMWYYILLYLFLFIYEVSCQSGTWRSRSRTSASQQNQHDRRSNDRWRRHIYMWGHMCD